MLRYALVITKNKEVAEDAVHNAFLSIIKHKEKYFSLPRRDMRILLVVITKNKCIDLLKQGNAFADDPIDEMDNVLPSKDIPIEEQLILNEEYEAIKKHVAGLDDKSRLVLEMKYLLDKDNQGTPGNTWLTTIVESLTIFTGRGNRFEKDIDINYRIYAFFNTYSICIGY